MTPWDLCTCTEDELKMLPRVPQMKTTLSHVSPDKAQQIRSAVTGALQHSQNGLFCFERTVETTFVLPWDLNPRVQPQKLSVSTREGIRNELLDASSLQHLELCGAINWNSTVVWQCRTGAGEWEAVDSHAAEHLEQGYRGQPSQCSFVVGFAEFQVVYNEGKLLNSSTNTLFEIRRLAFAPLMPMKTEEDTHSLYHAASLGFWGVHDRNSLLCEAVGHTLSDPKAQFLIYDRWSEEVARNNPGVKAEFPQWEAAKQNLAGAPQLHLFTLANIVQRPIIVYTHPDSPVGGIYLPLLWESLGGHFLCDTHPHLRNPLALGYDAVRRHFTPLVTFKGTRGPDPILLPLTYANGPLFTIHFLSAAQVGMDPSALLSKLMLVDIISSPAASPSMAAPTLAAISTADEMPEVMDSLVKRYQSLFL